MSLENAINKLTQVIKAVKGPKTTNNLGRISVDGNNCTCTERAGQSNICVSADCGDTFCRLMDSGWECKPKFKPSQLPQINMS